MSGAKPKWQTAKLEMCPLTLKPEKAIVSRIYGDMQIGVCQTHGGHSVSNLEIMVFKNFILKGGTLIKEFRYFRSRTGLKAPEDLVIKSKRNTCLCPTLVLALED